MLILILILILFFLIRYIGKAKNQKVPEGGISEEMYVDINGTKQWISIYGRDLNNPVLLYLHGGPGSATSPYDYAFTRKWSDVYTVVTWDQRNAGKSFDKAHEVEAITYDDMMKDGKEMTEFLLKHLSKDKLTLLGHSWGSMFGASLALEYPEYYEVFIGTGQCIDIDENEIRFAQAARKWAEGDKDAEKLLAKLNYEKGMDMDYITARNKLMKKYHYDMMKDGTDYNMFAAVLFNPYYSLKDILDYVLNVRRSLNPYIGFMSNGLKKFSLFGRYEYQIPYYNINGDIDYQTNFELACEYFEKVRAPYKKMYVMKDGTHGLLESRSAEFSQYVHEIAETQKENRS